MKCIISIIICTRNRVDSLINYSLKSLLEQKAIDKELYEIIIVDNKSTDNTHKKVNEIKIIYPNHNIKYFFEENLGLSYARNRGIKESLADIVAFIDDDAEANIYWVKEIIDAYQRYPEAVAIGGKTIPVATTQNKNIFKGKMLRFLGGHDLGINDLKLPKNLYLGGGNMSFKKSIFYELGFFNTKLGRIGEKNFSHEEGELFWRLIKQNKVLYYVPSAYIFHKPPASRTSFKSLINIRFFYGYSEAFVDREHFGIIFLLLKTGKKTLFNIPYFFYGLILLLLGKVNDLYYYFLKIIFNIGYLLGAINPYYLGKRKFNT